MRLVRADSARSAWFPWSPDAAPSAADEETVPDQRRVRHLRAVLVHNLSLDPRRDQLSAPLFAGPPPTEVALLPTSLPADPPALSSTSDVPRIRPRRASSAATLPPIPASAPADTLPGPALTRPRSTSRASFASASTVSTFRQAPRLPPPPSSASASTSAPGPSTDRLPRPPNAAQFAQREQYRRRDALRRRLVDSFVSLELVSPSTAEPGEPGPRRRSGSAARSILLQRSASSDAPNGGGDASVVVSPRKSIARRRTTSSASLPLTSTSVPSRPVAATVPVPTPPPFFISPLSRASTHATFPVDPAAYLLPPDVETETKDADQEYDPHPAAALPDDPARATWPGLRESRLLARVFARPSRPSPRDGPSPSSSSSRRRKGKGTRTQNDERGSTHGVDAEAEADEWRMLAEWDVELAQLTGLGRNPAAFPALPPNTLIFALAPSVPAFCVGGPTSSPLPLSSSLSSAPSTATSSTSGSSSSATTWTASGPAAATEIEYFTAPLATLRRAARVRVRSTSSAVTGRHRSGMRSRSEDEASDHDQPNEDDVDAGRGGGSDTDEFEPGHESDPGAGSSTLRSRRRRGRRSAYSSAGAHTPGRMGALPSGRTHKDHHHDGCDEEEVEDDNDHEEEEQLRRQAVLERSRRETRMVRCAGLAEARRLWVGEREYERVRAEGEEVRARVARALAGGRRGEGWASGERERAELQDRVDHLEAVRETAEQELQTDLAAIETRKADLRARRARLDQARVLEEADGVALEALRSRLDGQDRNLAELNDASRTRRTQLITLLSHIFPIEPVVVATAAEAEEAEKKKRDLAPPPAPALLFSIVGLALPNSSYPASYTDEALSSALGYAAQLTHLVAAFLGVPLCYPLRCRASRTVVVDEISMMKGPRAFPLYGRGVDRYRFDYGVFLLNKNIEQLMYSQGLTVLDLRNTLPNLKTLILSLSYDPSHADYRSATLSPALEFRDLEGVDGGAGASAASPRAPGGPSPAVAAMDEAPTPGRSRASSSASTIRPTRASRSSSNSSNRNAPRIDDRPGETRRRVGSTSRGRRSPAAVTVAAAGVDDPEEEGVASAEARSSRIENGDGDGAGGAGGERAEEGELPARSEGAQVGDDGVRGDRAEKRPLSAAAPLGSDSAAGETGSGVKVRVVKTPAPGSGGMGTVAASTAAAGGGGIGGGGYGARIRDGLWSAVAGHVAAAGGGHATTRGGEMR